MPCQILPKCRTLQLRVVEPPVLRAQAIFVSHQNGTKRQNDPRLEERCRRQVEDRVSQDDHVRPRDERDVSRNSAAELVAQRSGGLHEAFKAVHALLEILMKRSERDVHAYSLTLQLLLCTFSRKIRRSKQINDSSETGRKRNTSPLSRLYRLIALPPSGAHCGGPVNDVFTPTDTHRVEMLHKQLRRGRTTPPTNGTACFHVALLIKNKGGAIHSC